ncbi:hypothetical protein BROUX41_006478 [Berkeleyomyces rouxiae]
MEDPIRQLQSFPPPNITDLSDADYDRLIKEHVQLIMQGPVEQASGDITNATQFLQAKYLAKALDPAVHTISFGLVLEATLRKHSSDVTPLFASELLKFTALLDRIQIRYIGPSAVYLLDTILDLKILNATIAVDAVTTALLRIDPSISFLSSIRSRVVTIAYKASLLDLVMPLVSTVPLHFPGGPYPPAPHLCSRMLPPPEYMANMSATITSRDVLMYEMTCGLALCTKGQWKAARNSFGRCAVHRLRNGGLVNVSVDAYKRWILTTLIVLGSVGPATFPSPSTQIMHKVFSSLSKPYMEVAQAFGKSYADLQAQIDSHSVTWVRDNNAGLIEMVCGYYPKWQISRLQNIYRRCTVSEIQQHLSTTMAGSTPNLENTAAMVQAMISESMVMARLVPAQDNVPAHVVFLKPSEFRTPAELKARFNALRDSMARLESVGQDMTRLVKTLPDYVLAMNHDAKRKKPVPEGDKLPPADFDISMDDEDLMAGISTAA